MLKDKFYYKDGSVLSYRDTSKILHRENGPAIIWSCGDKFWYQDDELHNDKGPACLWEDESPKEYYLFGKQMPLASWGRECTRLRKLSKSKNLLSDECPEGLNPFVYYLQLP